MTDHLDCVSIELDSTAGVLRFWRHFSVGKSAPFMLIEIPVTELGMAERDVAEMQVGGIVLAALAEAHPALAKFQGDPLGRGTADLAATLDIEMLAHSGDPAAQNAHGMLLYDRSLELLRKDLLEQAEHWFRTAASSGEEAAVRFLESWPKIKQHRLDEITRRTGHK